LSITFGIDPSDKMLNYARRRNLSVDKGIAENLPYSDGSFDFAVFIASMCFIDDPAKALKETYRVIKDKGDLIIAFIDKESSLGRVLLAEKKESKFYRTANFYSVPEMVLLIETNNFRVNKIYQTLIDSNKKEIEKSIEGYGKGGFVVIQGKKK
jgi:ubiquinone/menaquinone biosynthesis C-methylase UbiE